ncbi:hypothetical protein [Massilia sp. H6]|uniref:hypothetical protein n=1 Tax=Massilia sp. H6 TaxID=2970464 RepID=UPI00216A9BC5|nr:hypothetical protein [Massilia sp. H6]UVW27776.1 hypothetical protein NRS07_14655 [Massilia sp. H6]
MNTTKHPARAKQKVDPEYLKAFEQIRLKNNYPTGKQSILRSGMLVLLALLVSLAYFQFADFGALPGNVTLDEVASLRLRLGLFGGAVLAMPLTSAYAAWLWVRHRRLLRETEAEMRKRAAAEPCNKQ